jgi:hypothetical protein
LLVKRRRIVIILLSHSTIIVKKVHGDAQGAVVYVPAAKKVLRDKPARENYCQYFLQGTVIEAYDGQREGEKMVGMFFACQFCGSGSQGGETYFPLPVGEQAGSHFSRG